MDRRKKTTGKIKGMFHTSGTKHGSYSVGLTVLVIAIVIVFNLVIGQIPEAYRNLDMSSTKIYEISDTTKDLLSGLNDKVDMKVLAVKTRMTGLRHLSVNMQHFQIRSTLSGSIRFCIRQH